MLLGTVSGTLGLALATQISTHSPYLQIVVSMVLLGAGAGMTFVALTNVSLEDVAPDVAGAASGLVNVSQQIGAAVGLAVLVTVFNAVGGRALTGAAAAATANVVHPLDIVFGVGALFALASCATVLFGVRRSPQAEPSLASARADETAGIGEGSVSDDGIGQLAWAEAS
ncbi:MAG TPA: hypothetical protein VIX84_22795, partial [Acidimicrobiales bacterium]